LEFVKQTIKQPHWFSSSSFQKSEMPPQIWIVFTHWALSCR